MRPARPAELERAGPRAPCRGLRCVSRARRRGIWKKRRGGRALGGSGLGSGSASCVSGRGTEEGQARGPLGRSDLSDRPGPLLERTGPASDVNRRRLSLLCLGSSRGGAVARSRGRAHRKAEGTGKEGPSGGLAGSGKPRDLASGEPWRAHWRDKLVGIANEKMVGLRTDLIPSMRVNSRWSPEPNAKL